jgi:glucose-6-phosphate 1-dehydrogenase
MIETLVVLGATGDLTGRYLLPALARLHDAEALNDRITVLGIDRAALDTGGFAAHAEERLARHAGDLESEAVEGLTGQLRYRQADVTDPTALAAALDDTSGPVAI